MNEAGLLHEDFNIFLVLCPNERLAAPRVLYLKRKNFDRSWVKLRNRMILRQVFLFKYSFNIL